MEELFVELDTGTDVVTPLDWTDTFRLALGLGEDITRGALEGEYDAAVDIVSAQVSYRF